MSEQLRGRAEKFTGLINRSPAFTQPAVLWRGVLDGKQMFGKPGTAKGRRFTDKGFVSLTASQQVAMTYGGTLLRMHIPAGAHALKASKALWDGAGNTPDYPVDLIREYTLAGGSFEVTADTPADPGDMFSSRTLDVALRLPAGQPAAGPKTAAAAGPPAPAGGDLAGLPGGERFAWQPGQVEFDGPAPAAAGDGGTTAEQARQALATARPGETAAVLERLRQAFPGGLRGAIGAGSPGRDVTVPVSRVVSVMPRPYPERVDGLRAEIRSGTDIGPSLAVKHAGLHYLVDGNHHAIARVLEGQDRIPVRELDLTAGPGAQG